MVFSSIIPRNFKFVKGSLKFPCSYGGNFPVIFLLMYSANTYVTLYMKYKSLKLFGLVRFYDISTIVGYLMPNPLYKNILNIFWLSLMAYQPL